MVAKKGWTDEARKASAETRKSSKPFIRQPAPASLSERMEAHRQSKNLTLSDAERAKHRKLGMTGYRK